MVRMDKCLSLFLVVILAVSNLLLVMSASAQMTPGIEVPEFAIAIKYSPYNAVDPYTGATQQIDNGTIELVIKNQPFTPRSYASANTNTSLFYNVQVKGHYVGNWQDIYSSGTFSYTSGWNNSNNYTWYDYPTQSNCENTTLLLPVWYEVGSDVDFRVQAVIANVTEISLPNFLPDNGLRYHAPTDYTQKIAWTSFYPSEWRTQTVTIPETSTSFAFVPDSVVPEFPITTTLIMVLAVVSLLLIIGKRTHSFNH